MEKSEWWPLSFRPSQHERVLEVLESGARYEGNWVNDKALIFSEKKLKKAATVDFESFEVIPKNLFGLF